MARKAIATTIASILLFTALVLADSTIVAAADNLASSAQASHVESREALLSEYSSGAALMDSLAQVQNFLSGNAAECSAIPEYLASITATSSVSGQDAGISYSSHVSVAEATASDISRSLQGDNLTSLSPFSGYRSGALLLGGRVEVSETGGGGLISLNKHEQHLLNLPISPGSAASLCGLALASLGAALSRYACNATLAQGAFDSIVPSLVAQAATQGFSLVAGWQQGAGCSARYWIILVEHASGAVGEFDWTVRGSGAIS